VTDIVRKIGGAFAGAWRWFTGAPWWVHVGATLGVIVSVLVIAATILAVLYLDFVREHGPLASEVPPQSEPETAERAELARRFAPVIRYDARELFVPISRSAYISRTQLKEQEGGFIRVAAAAPTVDALPPEEGACLRSRGCSYFLDVRGVEPDPPRDAERLYDPIENQLLRSERPTVYFHVTHYDDTDEYAVQYWFLYFFNFRLNEHESDWEQVTVRLNGDKEPVDVYYSAHEGGNVKSWDAIESEGDHPVVYPARGSHANYFSPGRHRVKVACRRVIGSIQSCLRGRRVLVDVTDGRGTALEAADYELTEMSGPVFIGSYGSGNYVVLTRRADILADPRTRGLWADPFRDLR
jgi:hypothetical protein